MKAVKAENYFCFFALLEMVLQDMGYFDMDQIGIADFFEVVFPSNYTVATRRCSYSEKTWEFGAHVGEKDINLFFTENNIRCSCFYLPINTISEVVFEDTINEMLQSKDYLIVTYSYGLLYRKHDLRDIGHVGLLSKTLPSFKVEIYDPGPKNDGYRVVDGFDLYDAMRFKQGGIYLFKREDDSL